MKVISLKNLEQEIDSMPAVEAFPDIEPSIRNFLVSTFSYRMPIIDANEHRTVILGRYEHSPNAFTMIYIDKSKSFALVMVKSCEHNLDIELYFIWGNGRPVEAFRFGFYRGSDYSINSFVSPPYDSYSSLDTPCFFQNLLKLKGNCHIEKYSSYEITQKQSNALELTFDKLIFSLHIRKSIVILSLKRQGVDVFKFKKRNSEFWIQLDSLPDEYRVPYGIWVTATAAVDNHFNRLAEIFEYFSDLDPNNNTAAIPSRWEQEEPEIIAGSVASRVPPPAHNTPTSDGDSVEGRLQRLNELLEKGLISEAEYTSKRNKILDEL